MLFNGPAESLILTDPSASSDHRHAGIMRNKLLTDNPVGNKVQYL